MTELQLSYGDGSVTFDFAANRYDVLSAHSISRPPLADAEIGAALSTPIESPPLEDLIPAGDSVLLIVSDATRATASGQILNLLIRRLIQSGVSPADMAIIFATGIHRLVTAAEKLELLTPFIAQRVKTIDHDARDPSQMIALGQTDRGTPVELNRALKDYDHTVITGGLGFHYFAGFTGGRKSICPGLASAKTIAATHMLAFDFERGGRRAGVGAALLDGNAVHEECERIAALVEPRFGINTVVNEHGQATGVFAGDWRAAHRAGCREYLATHSLQIEQRRDLVIVSGGGSPYDINLIQAHKALEMAAHACNEGGAIILLAECRDGLGQPQFLKWFDEKNAGALELRLREAYEVNGQTAWSLLSKAERYRIYLVSNLPEEDVIRMRMLPAKTLQHALRQAGDEAPGYIMPHGARFLPVAVARPSGRA